jgi:hypothetical protein
MTSLSKSKKDDFVRRIEKLRAEKGNGNRDGGDLYSWIDDLPELPTIAGDAKAAILIKKRRSSGGGPEVKQ